MPGPEARPEIYLVNQVHLDGIWQDKKFSPTETQVIATFSGQIFNQHNGAIYLFCGEVTAGTYQECVMDNGVIAGTILINQKAPLEVQNALRASIISHGGSRCA